MPACVGPKTLVIGSSYSGNTEETLNCLQEAIKKKAKIFCLAGGGRLLALAKKHKVDAPFAYVISACLEAKDPRVVFKRFLERM